MKMLVLLYADDTVLLAESAEGLLMVYVKMLVSLYADDTVLLAESAEGLQYKRGKSTK
jgi:hypothetical protein